MVPTLGGYLDPGSESGMTIVSSGMMGVFGLLILIELNG